MKCSLCQKIFQAPINNKCPHCGQAVLNSNSASIPSMEWATAFGGFDCSTTRPYNVEPFKNGLRIRDIGLQGTAELALRSDLFDGEGMLYSRTATNIIKKFSTAQGFIDIATCVLQGDVISNLALYDSSIYAMLDTGFLAKIDCQTMTAVYLNVTKLVSDTYTGVNFLPPKNLLFCDGYVLFASLDRLFRLELDTATLNCLIFRDATLTQTAVMSNTSIYIVNMRCEIHKIAIEAFNDTSFEANADNTASFYRRGFLLPHALVFAEGALHFRLQTAEDSNAKLFYVCIDKFPEGRVYAVNNDTCRARFVLPSVANGKVYVGANAFYALNDTDTQLKFEAFANTNCDRSCQKIPAGCSSKIAPPIHYYGEGVGKIGHELYPGQIAFLNQRVSMFQSLKVAGKHKFFVITAVFKDYFAARSNDTNVYILERASEQ